MMTTENPRFAEIRAEAAELYALHGLTGWTFGFDKAKNRLGVCNSHRKSITISRILAEHGKPEDVTDTLLHEIAHALVEIPGVTHHGHDRVWKAKAISIGCNPSASAAVVLPPEALMPKGKIKRVFIPTAPGRKRPCKAQIGSLVTIPGHGVATIISAGSKNFKASLDSGINYVFSFRAGEEWLVKDAIASVVEEKVAA